MTAAKLAGEAAEAIRQLNHATRPAAGGLACPADAYDVAGELSALSARLIQALAQLAGFCAASTPPARSPSWPGRTPATPAPCWPR